MNSIIAVIVFSLVFGGFGLWIVSKETENDSEGCLGAILMVIRAIILEIYILYMRWF